MTDPPSYAADTPELRLLFASAAWPQTESDRIAIRQILGTTLDERRFLLLVEHHRLVPLVARNLLASVPEETLPSRAKLFEELRRLAEANSLRALRSLAELRRLADRFAQSGITVRVLKGLAVAQTIFGDISLRAAGDTDLLIPEENLPEADYVLRENGYRGLFDLKQFSARQLAFYRMHWKDNAYANDETGSEVDLHWRCFRNRKMPGGRLCAAGAGEIVSFGNFQVRTLPRTENLLYLCVHGTLDGWLYLKSLADVAAAVRAMPRESLDQLARAAGSYDILPELSAALLLVRRYFGMESWPGDLLPQRHPIVRHILRFAHRSLEGRGFLATREDIPVRSIVAFELGLRDDARYRRELLLRILFRARMWQTIPLPDRLFGLYPLLSPFEWVAFRLRLRRATRTGANRGSG